MHTHNPNNASLFFLSSHAKLLIVLKRFVTDVKKKKCKCDKKQITFDAFVQNLQKGKTQK